MVSLSADDDRQLGSIRLFGIPERIEGFDHLWVLITEDVIELSLRNAIAVNDDSAWQRPVAFLVEPKTFFHHVLQIRDHLVESQPRSVLNPFERLTSCFDF